MAYKLAEEDKLCGVIYPTYEGFSPIPKATCEMLESKCEQTIVVKCGESSEEDKKPESQSGSVSASVSESTSVSESISESNSTSESQASTSESTSESTSTESTSESTSTESTSTSESTTQSESTSESTTSTSESKSDSTSTSQSNSTSSSESASTSESNSVSESTSDSTSAESTSVSESTTESTTTSESTSVSTSESNSESVSTNSTSESSSDSTSVLTSNSQSDSTSKSDSTSTSESTSTSDSKSDSTSVSISDSTSVSSSTSTSNSTSESTTSVSNSQSESTLMSTSESKSESISASGSTSLSNSTSTSTSVSNSLSTTEPPSESELASTSLSEISSEEYVAHSNEISTIEASLERATSILNGMLNEEIYVRRGNPYKPMYLKETVLNALSRANSIYATKNYLSENLTVNDVHIDPRYKMDSEHEPDRVPLVFDITLPWGGRRTMVVPTFVRYMDEDIEKPEPDRYLEGLTDEIPADMSRDDLTDTLKLHYIFGQATFDGDTLIHVRNSNGGKLTKEDFTKFEEYVSKESENILNKGISGTHKYHAKAELRQESKEGDRVFTQKEVNIFSMHILVTQPSGKEYLIGEPVTTAIIDTL